MTQPHEFVCNSGRIIPMLSIFGANHEVRICPPRAAYGIRLSAQSQHALDKRKREYRRQQAARDFQRLLDGDWEW